MGSQDVKHSEKEDEEKMEKEKKDDLQTKKGNFKEEDRDSVVVYGFLANYSCQFGADKI